MNTTEITATLSTLLGELVNGAPNDGAYMLNGGDVGLLRSLDKLSASHASASSHGGATIAAHVDHVCYGLALLNRWTAGEPNPWADADWSVAWRTTTVNDEEWATLRRQLGDEAHRWLDAIGQPRDVNAIELNGMIGSIAHVAYHLGAIRQIDRTARGPADGERAG